MTVSELADACGVSADVIRYYVRIGLLDPVTRLANGYRLFSRREVSRVRFIRQAKSLGYTLGDIRAIFKDADGGRTPCPRVREIIRRRIGTNRSRLTELLALQERMEQALRRWDQMPDALPDGESICHLIESADD